MGWPGQASEHEPDHGEADEGGDAASVAFEVARQASIATDPCQSSFDDPAFGQDDEVVSFSALNDLEHPAARVSGRLCGLRSLISGVGEDALDEREETTGALVEDQSRAVAILHGSRMDDDVQQEAERVDENVPLAARDLLARIIALRVKRGAPF